MTDNKVCPLKEEVFKKLINAACVNFRRGIFELDLFESLNFFSLGIHFS